MASNNTSPGTVRPLGNDRWLLRVSAGNDPLTGKRLQPSRVICGSRDEALRGLVNFQHEVLLGHVPHDKMTLNQLFDLWVIAPTKGGRLRATNTKYHDQGRYRRYVQPSLGNRQASSLKPKDFSFLYDALLSRPMPKRSTPLSPRTVHHVHSLLRAMYTWAWRRDLVSENPVLKVDNPSVPLNPPQAPHRHVVQEHLEILWSSNNDLATAVWLAATLGLRRSEIAALKFSHFDFKGNQIHIVSGVTKTPGSQFQVTNTKTGLHGYAVFPLHPYTKEVLEQRRVEFRKQLQSLGVALTPLRGHLLRENVYYEKSTKDVYA
jgi:integrase